MDFFFMAFIPTALAFLFLFMSVFGGRQKVEDKINMPYRAKKYFFSRSEQEFFNILNAHLDATRYTVFPKVRLGDFVEVDYSARKDRTWWNKIRAKHIDYLIWDLAEDKIVLAIELDGNSHNSEVARKRDNFVNGLYAEIGIKLERVRVGQVFSDEIERITCQLKTE